VARKTLIINGHPDAHPKHFCDAIVSRYQLGAATSGTETKSIVVANLEFSFLRSKNEFDTSAVSSDIKDAQSAIHWADNLVIVYPLWLGTMPALLKAFFEQTLRPGFAFSHLDQKYPVKLLKGKSARIIITMGMPALVYRLYFRAHGAKNLKRNILQICGISPVRITLFGRVETADHRRHEKFLEYIAELGRRGI